MYFANGVMVTQMIDSSEEKRDILSGLVFSYLTKFSTYLGASAMQQRFAGQL